MGTLLTPNNAIDTTTGTIPLKATFANDDDTCGPASSSMRGCSVGTMQQAVTVPAAAVQHGPDGLFIYTVKPDSTVQQSRTSRLGYQIDGHCRGDKGSVKAARTSCCQRAVTARARHARDGD